MILGQIRSGLEDEILAPRSLSPAKGEEKNWREERGGGDETKRIETRNLNGLCPLFATTITRKESPGNFEGVRAIPIRGPFVRIGHWRAGVEKRARV